MELWSFCHPYRDRKNSWGHAWRKTQLATHLCAQNLSYEWLQGWKPFWSPGELLCSRFALESYPGSFGYNLPACTYTHNKHSGKTGGDIAQRTLPKSSCVCMKSEAKASPSIYYPGSHKSTPSKQALHRYITIANHSRPFHTAPKHCQPSSLCHGLYTIPLPSTSISLPRINDQPKTRRYLN